MDSGKRFSIPHYEGVVGGENWIPAMPGKPVNSAQTGIADNQTGGDNWQELLGFCTGILQNEAKCDLPREFNSGVTSSNTTAIIALPNIDNGSTNNRLPQNFKPNGCKGNNLEHKIQEVSTFQNLMSSNRNVGSSYMQKSGEVIRPQKVNSLAELIGSTDGSTHIMRKPTVVVPQAPAKSSQMTCKAVGVQQNHIFLDGSSGGYRLQQTPNSAGAVPHRKNYNLNLPPSLEAGESPSGVFSLGPITPELQKQSKNYGSIRVPNSFLDDISAKEIHEQNNAFSFQQPEILEREHNESLLNTPDQPTDATSTSPTAKTVPGGGNKTAKFSKTPRQKTPKRRKHRPKVVVEGKPKRTRKPAATKPGPADGKPATKRKYVRKTGTTPSTNTVENVENVVEASGLRHAATVSCKRAINFDLNNGMPKEGRGSESSCQEQYNEKRQLPFDLNLDSNNAEWLQSEASAFVEGHRNVSKEMPQMQTRNNSNTFVSEESIPLTTTAPTPPTSKDHSLNIIARILKGQNASINQIGENRQKLVHQELAQLIIQANSSDPNLHNGSQFLSQTMPILPKNSIDTFEKRGSKRVHSQTVVRQPENITPMGSQLLSCGSSETGPFNTDGSELLHSGLEMWKRRRIEDKFRGTLCSAASGVTTIENFSKQKESGSESFLAGSSKMHQNGGLANFNSNGQSIPRYANTSDKVINNRCMNSPNVRCNFQRQYTPVQMHLDAEKMTGSALNLSKELNTSALSAVTNWNLESASQRDPKCIQTSGTITSPDTVTVKRMNVGRTPSKKAPTKDKVLQKKSKKVTGLRKDIGTSLTVDNITNHMKALQIDDKGKQKVWDEKSAIVPYGGGAAIVPYEEFDQVKKRKARPRVDLDPETNRLWNLLMGKEGSESAETMDTDKQKWWEGERNIFRGRVDSFIARMHLVQGDRRFSKWKGSVVDSVIGVFLTQNVSDHLSSSAFMSLAAKFPLKLAVRKPCGESTRSPPVRHQVVCVTYPDGTTYKHKVIREIRPNNSSVTSIGSSEDQAENVMTEKGTFSINDRIRRLEEDMLSSQSSSGSFASGSNSEVEDGWNCRKNRGHFSVFKQAEQIIASQKYQSQSDGKSNKIPLIGRQLLENTVQRHNVGPSSSNEYSFPLIPEVPNHQRSGEVSKKFWTNLLMGQETLDGGTPDLSGKESRTSLAATEDGCNFRQDPGQFSVSEQAEQIAGSEQYQSQFGGGLFPKPLTGHQQPEDTLHSQNVGPSSNNVYSSPIISEVPDHQSTGEQSGKFWTNLLMCREITDEDIPDLSAKESTTSLAAKDFEISNEKQQFQPSQANCLDLNNCCEPQTEFPDASHNRNGQHFRKHGQGNRENSQQDSAFPTESVKSTEASNKEPYDNRTPANKTPKPNEKGKEHFSEKPPGMTNSKTSNTRKRKAEKNKEEPFNWDDLRKQFQLKCQTGERSMEAMDSLDYEALRNANFHEISETIKERGMNNMLAERIKDFLDRLVKDHGKIDLEWLRDVPPDKAKDYLLSIWGLGLKSVECVRLLTLHHLAFPVDTNVGRIAVRLGWVPLEPLPESIQLHLLELYPMLDSVQKHLWPRLCMLDQETLYELHYQMITFGKVFCTKRDPNCNACPMKGDCRHFASAFASARRALPGPEESRIVSSAAPVSVENWSGLTIKPMPLPSSEDNVETGTEFRRNSEPLIEEPTTPEPPLTDVLEKDIEDAFYEDPDEIPTIDLNVEEFTSNLQSFMEENMEMGGDISKALIALAPQFSIPESKLKHVNRLRTEHRVYELPDSHPVLKGMDRREPDDPSPYLLAIWAPGETADSVKAPETVCSSHGGSGFCNKKTCSTCNNTIEAETQTVRGTILVPCRTAMRGSFPLNGTYFQVNEVFADHESSMNPIDVPRSMIWYLPRRTVFFGTSVSTIFRGLSTEGIQYCFWKGFVCVRGFDQKTRAPKPLVSRLHSYTSKTAARNE